MNTPEQVRLKEAQALFSQGKIKESEHMFSDLVNSDEVAPQANAALGLIKASRGNLDDASALFTKALARGANADAFYGLGVVAERRGRLGDAIVQFQRALETNPNHAGARQRLSVLLNQVNRTGTQASNAAADQRTAADKRTTVSSSSSPTVPDDAPVPDAQAGLFNMLASDGAHVSSPSAELSRECLKFIKALDLDRGPRWSAYLGTGLVVWLGLVAVFSILVKSSRPPISPLFLLIVVTVLLAIGAFRCIAIARTHYAMRGGWLFVRRGVINNDDEPYELTHLIKVELKRGPLDQLSGNGALHMTFDKGDRLTIRGLARIDELREIRDRLNSLSRMLRSHPMLKGLVT